MPSSTTPPGLKHSILSDRGIVSLSTRREENEAPQQGSPWSSSSSIVRPGDAAQQRGEDHDTNKEDGHYDTYTTLPLSLDMLKTLVETEKEKQQQQKQQEQQKEKPVPVSPPPPPAATTSSDDNRGDALPPPRLFVPPLFTSYPMPEDGAHAGGVAVGHEEKENAEVPTIDTAPSPIASPSYKGKEQGGTSSTVQKGSRKKREEGVVVLGDTDINAGGSNKKTSMERQGQGEHHYGEYPAPSPPHHHHHPSFVTMTTTTTTTTTTNDTNPHNPSSTCCLVEAEAGEDTEGAHVIPNARRRKGRNSGMNEMSSSSSSSSSTHTKTPKANHKERIEKKSDEVAPSSDANKALKPLAEVEGNTITATLHANTTDGGILVRTSPSSSPLLIDSSDGSPMLSGGRAGVRFEDEQEKRAGGGGGGGILKTSVATTNTTNSTNSTNTTTRVSASGAIRAWDRGTSSSSHEPRTPNVPVVVWAEQREVILDISTSRRSPSSSSERKTALDQEGHPLEAPVDGPGKREAAARGESADDDRNDNDDDHRIHHHHNNAEKSVVRRSGSPHHYHPLFQIDASTTPVGSLESAGRDGGAGSDGDDCSGSGGRRGSGEIISMEEGGQSMTPATTAPSLSFTLYSTVSQQKQQQQQQQEAGVGTGYSSSRYTSARAEKQKKEETQAGSDETKTAASHHHNNNNNNDDDNGTANEKMPVDADGRTSKGGGVGGGPLMTNVTNTFQSGGFASPGSDPFTRTPPSTASDFKKNNPSSGELPDSPAAVEEEEEAKRGTTRAAPPPPPHHHQQQPQQPRAADVAMMLMTSLSSVSSSSSLPSRKDVENGSAEPNPTASERSTPFATSSLAASTSPAMTMYVVPQKGDGESHHHRRSQPKNPSKRLEEEEKPQNAAELTDAESNLPLGSLSAGFRSLPKMEERFETDRAQTSGARQPSPIGALEHKRIKPVLSIVTTHMGGGGRAPGGRGREERERSVASDLVHSSSPDSSGTRRGVGIQPPPPPQRSSDSASLSTDIYPSSQPAHSPCQGAEEEESEAVQYIGSPPSPPENIHAKKKTKNVIPPRTFSQDGTSSDRSSNYNKGSDYPSRHPRPDDHDHHDHGHHKNNNSHDRLPHRTPEQGKKNETHPREGMMPLRSRFSFAGDDVDLPCPTPAPLSPPPPSTDDEKNHVSAPNAAGTDITTTPTAAPSSRNEAAKMEAKRKRKQTQNSEQKNTARPHDHEEEGFRQAEETPPSPPSSRPKNGPISSHRTEVLAMRQKSEDHPSKGDTPSPGNDEMPPALPVPRLFRASDDSRDFRPLPTRRDTTAAAVNVSHLRSGPSPSLLGTPLASPVSAPPPLPVLPLPPTTDQEFNLASYRALHKRRFCTRSEELTFLRTHYLTSQTRLVQLHDHCRELRTTLMEKIREADYWREQLLKLRQMALTEETAPPHLHAAGGPIFSRIRHILLSNPFTHAPREVLDGTLLLPVDGGVGGGGGDKSRPASPVGDDGGQDPHDGNHRPALPLNANLNQQTAMDSNSQPSSAANKAKSSALWLYAATRSGVTSGSSGVSWRAKHTATNNANHSGGSKCAACEVLLQELRKNLARRDNDLSAMQMEFNDLSHSRHTMERELRTVKNELHQRTEERNQLQQTLLEKEKAIDTLSQSERSAMEEREKLSKEIEKLQQKNEVLELISGGGTTESGRRRRKMIQFEEEVFDEDEDDEETILLRGDGSDGDDEHPSSSRSRFLVTEEKVVYDQDTGAPILLRRQRRRRRAQPWRAVTASSSSSAGGRTSTIIRRTTKTTRASPSLLRHSRSPGSDTYLAEHHVSNNTNNNNNNNNSGIPGVQSCVGEDIRVVKSLAAHVAEENLLGEVKHLQKQLTQYRAKWLSAQDDVEALQVKLSQCKKELQNALSAADTRNPTTTTVNPSSTMESTALTPYLREMESHKEEIHRLERRLERQADSASYREEQLRQEQMDMQRHHRTAIHQLQDQLQVAQREVTRAEEERQRAIKQLRDYVEDGKLKEVLQQQKETLQQRVTELTHELAELRGNEKELKLSVQREMTEKVQLCHEKAELQARLQQKERQERLFNDEIQVLTKKVGESDGRAFAMQERLQLLLQHVQDQEAKVVEMKQQQGDHKDQKDEHRSSIAAATAAAITAAATQIAHGSPCHSHHHPEAMASELKGYAALMSLNSQQQQRLSELESKLLATTNELFLLQQKHQAELQKENIRLRETQIEQLITGNGPSGLPPSQSLYSATPAADTASPRLQQLRGSLLAEIAQLREELENNRHRQQVLLTQWEALHKDHREVTADNQLLALGTEKLMQKLSSLREKTKMEESARKAERKKLKKVECCRCGARPMSRSAATHHCEVVHDTSARTALMSHQEHMDVALSSFSASPLCCGSLEGASAPCCPSCAGFGAVCRGPHISITRQRLEHARTHAKKQRSSRGHTTEATPTSAAHSAEGSPPAPPSSSSLRSSHDHLYAPPIGAAIQTATTNHSNATPSIDAVTISSATSRPASATIAQRSTGNTPTSRIGCISSEPLSSERRRQADKGSDGEHRARKGKVQFVSGCRPAPPQEQQAQPDIPEEEGGNATTKKSVVPCTSSVDICISHDHCTHNHNHSSSSNDDNDDARKSSVDAVLRLEKSLRQARKEINEYEQLLSLLDGTGKLESLLQEALQHPPANCNHKKKKISSR